MDKKDLQRALRLQKEADTPKRKKKKETDIFTDVKKRKRDIDARQKTVDNREELARLEEERMQDTIYRETCRTATEKADRKFKRRARNLELRSQLIRKLTHNSYKCPACKEVKTSISQWVIATGCSKVVCRQCYSSRGWEALDYTEVDLTKIELFKEPVYRYKIDAIALCRMRKTLRMSVEDFSSSVGWAVSYQYQLEAGEFAYVSEKTMSEICQLISRKGFEIKKDVWGTPKIRFNVNGCLIKNARTLKSISLRAFASQAGWSHSYQSKLESGSVQTISKEVADIISKIVNRML
jgi:transcriptional regulator with XRE-family HTH domain